MLDMCSLLRIIFVRSSVSFSNSSFVRVLGSLGSWVRLGWGFVVGFGVLHCFVLGCLWFVGFLPWGFRVLLRHSEVVLPVPLLCHGFHCSGFQGRLLSIVVLEFVPEGSLGQWRGGGGGESVSSWFLSGEGGFVFTLFFCFFGFFLPVEWMFRTGKL